MDILTHIDLYTQLGMYTYKRIHMNLGLYIIHSCRHRIRHGDTNVLTKHTHTITHTIYVDTCSYTHMRKYANKRRLMHTWKNSHIFSHTCTSAQEELLTLITDKHMQRQPHTQTRTHSNAFIGQEWCVRTFTYTVLQHMLQNKQW